MKKLLPYIALSPLLLAAHAAIAQQAPQHPAPQAPASPGVILVMPGNGGSSSPTPEELALMQQSREMYRDAARALYAGRYAEAEAEARESIALRPHSSGVDEEILAAALDAQGEDREALQQYQVVVEHVSGNPRNLLPYALLLLKSGQWAQAVVVYDQAVSQFPTGTSLAPVETHFSPDVPEPTALALALHIELGRLYNAGTSWGGETQNTEAMAEYTKALQLAPDSALTNYYYGVGWQRLTPAERAKFGTVQQAKAHLRKAEKVGNANIRAAAKKALKALG